MLGGATAKQGKNAKGKKGKKKGGRDKLTDAEKAEFIAKNDAECVAVFTKAGYKDVQPRVNVMMGYFASPTSEDDGFLMEISPERWLDALNAAERILGRTPDAGLEPQMIRVLRDYQNNAANMLTQFLDSKPNQQPKDLN